VGVASTSVPVHAATAAKSGDPDPSRRASGGQRVAVLGGTGLIGSAAVRALVNAGCDVVVLARRPPAERCAPLLAGAKVLLGSASDPVTLRKALDGADHVVDALGAPHPADSVRAPMAQFDAEIPVLLGVLDELRHRPAASLTYLSSGGAIYGNALSLPVPEEAECNPVSPYGVTKLAAERYVLIAGHADGLDARILRVANAYGALQRPGTGQGLVAALLHAAATGTPVHVFGDGSAVRDFIEVRDAATAIVELREARDAPRILNVGTGVGHTLLDVLAIVEDTTGASIRVVHEPPRASDVRAVVLDTSRLSRVLSWHPASLDVGVRDTWATWGAWGLGRADEQARAR
jgi:UDP-glucose 4-epimerase